VDNHIPQSFPVFPNWCVSQIATVHRHYCI